MCIENSWRSIIVVFVLKDTLQTIIMGMYKKAFGKQDVLDCGNRNELRKSKVEMLDITSKSRW